MLEVDFLAVGAGTKSGDAICLRYGQPDNATIHIIDGGYTETGPQIVEHINANYNYPALIEHVVLTHPDTDHISGLFHVLETFSVAILWMNRPWLHAQEIIGHFHGNWTLAGLTEHLKEQFATLYELEQLAISRGTTVMSVFQGQNIGEFTVLAPSRQRYLDLLVQLPNTPAQVKQRKGSFLSRAAELVERAAMAAKNYIIETWYGETLSENPPATSPSNETSIVQGAIIEGKKILLTGDVGPAGLAEAYEYASSQFGFSQPDLVQVPHHGSRRNVTPSTLNNWLGNTVVEGHTRGVAVCSAAENDLDHPKAKVENAFLRRGYPVHTTKGQLKYYSSGIGRGYGSSYPAPFRTTVED